METLLEIPVNKREAKERGVSPRLARFVFTVDEEGRVAEEVLWQAVQLCRPSDKSTFVHPIGAFTSIEALSKKLDRQDERFSFLPELHLASVLPNQNGTDLLRSWHAEMLVLFFAAESAAQQVIRNLPSLTEKWWHLTNEGPEAAYVKQLNICDPFLFFSETRSSIEVLGSRRQVFACFDKIRCLIDK